MACCELRYFSKALDKQTAASVILPEKQPGPYSVLYLLHGLSDDHSTWARRTSIERYVEDLPLLVVMPDGGRGFYCDAVDGFAYETALVRDLVDLVDRTFPTRATRAGRSIGGLSMGGYGAVKIALRFPELFCSANSHSGAFGFAHVPWHDAKEFGRIVGGKWSGGPNDLFLLAETIDHSKLPQLRIDCGRDDFLFDSNREFHEHLEKLKVPHEYEEFSGAHDWAYWDLHVQEAIQFHARNLGL